MKFFLLVIVPIASLSIWVLISLLRKLVNEQVEEQVKNFANQAKIPKFLSNRIGIRIKWR